MKFVSTGELCEKVVVNVCKGATLGYPSEFELNISDGSLVAIIIANETGFLGLGKKEEIVIPWDKIQCIGDDTIIVKLVDDELKNCTRNPKKKKKGL